MIFKSILLATDFSKPSLQLVDCIAELRDRGLEKVFIVHIVDVRAPGGASVSLKEYDEQALNNARERLSRLGLDVGVRVEIGFPAQEIIRIAREEQVSMIAVASRGENFITRIFIGSTTQDVLRLSPIPVMVEKFIDLDRESCAALCANRFKRILMPIDFSLCTDRTLAVVRELAGEIDELLLLSVIERARDSEELARLSAERESGLQHLQGQFAAEGIKCRTLLEYGAASPHIIDTAKREGVSLIVMAKLGESRIKELLLGSTAHAVVRRAEHPVLLIP